MRLPLALLFAMATGCESLPFGENKPGPASTLKVVSGAAQVGAVGELLRDSILVQALDEENRAVAGARVLVDVDPASGTIAPSQRISGPDGMAAFAWTLGSEPGQMRVSASLSGTAAAQTITATALPLPAAVVTANADTLRLVRPVQFQIQVVARDKHGNVIANPTIVWNSANGQVATVNGSGLVSSVGPGVTTITARVDDATALIIVEIAVTT